MMVGNGDNSNPLGNLDENGVPHYVGMTEETPFYSPEADDAVINVFLPRQQVFQDVLRDLEELGLSPSSILDGGMAVPQEADPVPLMGTVEGDSVFQAEIISAVEATDLVQEDDQDDQDGDGSQPESPGKRNLTQGGVSTQEQDNLSGSHLNEFSDPAQGNLEDVDMDEVEGRGNRPVKRKLAMDTMSLQDQENLSSQPKFMRIEELLHERSGPSHSEVNQEIHSQDARMEDYLLVIVVQEEEPEYEEENAEEEIDDDSPSGWTSNWKSGGHGKMPPI